MLFKMYSLTIVFGLLTVFTICYSQDFITPEYVRADEYGTAYFRSPAPKIGPTKSRIHIENLIKLENELIGLGELILETEEKLHQRQQLEKAERLKKLMQNKKAGKNYEVEKEKLDDEDEHHEHDYTKEAEYIEKMKMINTAILEQAERYTYNPLAMYPIRKRLAYEWPDVLKSITNCSMVHSYPAINEHFRYLKFFLEADGDIDVAHEDLLRLQKLYRIPVSSLARGWWGTITAPPLNITDIIAIADLCLDREDMEGALEWLLQVAKLVKGLGLQGKEKLRYMNILGSAYMRVGKFQEAKLVYSNILKEDPQNRIAQANIELANTKIKQEQQNAIREKEREKEAKLRRAKKMMGNVGKVEVTVEEDDESDDSDLMAAGRRYKRKLDEDETYKEEWWMKFCRGDRPADPREETHLYCHEKYIPLMDNTIKVEVLSTTPPIYLLKGVLTENMMKQTIHHAQKEMEERIHAYTVEDASTPLIYTDETSWMEPFVFRMRNITYQKYNVETHDRVNLLSAIRMYNVGAGGTSNPGRAEMRINRRKPGHIYNFIGRYIHFMKVPERGGDFVFPWANIRVTPERGDILFWQFRTPVGLVHPKVYHWLECPIMTGEMWYAEQIVEHHRMIKKVDFDYVPPRPVAKNAEKQTKDKPESDKTGEKSKKSKKTKTKKSTKKSSTKTK